MNHHGTLNDILRILARKRIAIASIENKGVNGIHIIFEDTTRLIWWRGMNDEKVDITDPDHKERLGWYFYPKRYLLRRFWSDHESTIGLALTIIGLLLSALGLYFTLRPQKNPAEQSITWTIGKGPALFDRAGGQASLS